MTNPSAVVVRVIAGGLLLLTVAGCMSGQGEVAKWVQQEKAKKGAPLEPPPAIKTFETFEYTLRAPEDRDPFDLPTSEEQEETVNAGPRPDQNRAREPLESFPL
ncbi:MAG TPA: pilus assembly protein PilP, partial [Dokdonella sp.]|uniref:pilus assembly protein PilP n=1 Tax=Dokdonella sp. TaxID=2291710 RepID=UPI002D80964D